MWWHDRKAFRKALLNCYIYIWIPYLFQDSDWYYNIWKNAPDRGKWIRICCENPRSSGRLASARTSLPPLRYQCPLSAPHPALTSLEASFNRLVLTRRFRFGIRTGTKSWDFFLAFGVWKKRYAMVCHGMPLLAVASLKQNFTTFVLTLLRPDLTPGNCKEWSREFNKELNIYIYTYIYIYVYIYTCVLCIYIFRNINNYNRNRIL